MRDGLIRRLKSLAVWLSICVVVGLIVLGCVVAPSIASDLGLPPIVGAVLWAVIVLAAIAIGIVTWFAWLIFCRYREWKATKARIAELDRTISERRARPGEDAALAAALEEKVWGLVLINSVREAKEVQAELVRVAAASADSTLWDRVEEFRHMLDEPPDED
jgi:hypothetical protein